MAAEVVRGYNEEGDGKRDIVTRDLLGRRSADIELQLPVELERHLDQMSGKARNKKRDSDLGIRDLHDLNLPPPSAGNGIATEESCPLELTLSATTAVPISSYRSVCTLEKVRSALERAEQESRWTFPRISNCERSPSPSSSMTSSSRKDRTARMGDLTRERDSPSPDRTGVVVGGMVVAGCPGCFLYVLISTAEPRCPRCRTDVPYPALKMKKPRIDLNATLFHH
ncbi:hypothetical protein HPP92_003753 [Vanilla planifolia]|uniref:GIR1-like zinc ribbon domain-containing protein n=1 Tax=Vanilla planifolia TaxID=51239 RepID=A0A835VNY4_VANPL|nr:hypothetical protein HPP92_003753 [Vanilla planifolia]